jgi:hypothetical protein
MDYRELPTCIGFDRYIYIFGGIVYYLEIIISKVKLINMRILIWPVPVL